MNYNWTDAKSYLNLDCVQRLALLFSVLLILLIPFLRYVLKYLYKGDNQAPHAMLNHNFADSIKTGKSMGIEYMS